MNSTPNFDVIDQILEECDEALKDGFSGREVQEKIAGIRETTRKVKVSFLELKIEIIGIFGDQMGISNGWTDPHGITLQVPIRNRGMAGLLVDIGEALESDSEDIWDMAHSREEVKHFIGRQFVGVCPEDGRALGPDTSVLSLLRQFEGPELYLWMTVIEGVKS